jgi:hypothetical protein
MAMKLSRCEIFTNFELCDKDNNCEKLNDVL